MSEEVNDDRWQEICQWAEEEWVGGGSVTSNGEDITFWSAVGVLILKFFTYKHKREDPRTLYRIDLINPEAGGKGSFPIIFSEGTEIPDTLDEFLKLFAQKEQEKYPNNVTMIRVARRQIKAVQGDKGYPSLVEVYAYVIHQLREPVAHEELHTDVSGYEESVATLSEEINRELGE